MPPFRFAVTFAILFCLAHDGLCENLPPFGPLPKLAENWVALKNGQRNGTAWTVFRNSKTGDFLSFASRNTGKMRDLIYFSDSACEIFASRGQFAPPDLARPVMISLLRNKVTKLSLMSNHQDLSRDTLEYSWVGTTEDGAESWMAHGHVMLFGDVCIFVQHTSVKPISPDFIEGVAVDLISIHAEQPAVK